LELRLLESAAPEAVFASAQAVLARLRMQKDAGEIDNMRRAVQAAQRALQAVLPLARAGMTERELASELTMQLLRSGSDSELPFPPIVSSGPNSANPHASPSDRKLTPGDLLVIDWGAAVGGYFADLTRTLRVGEVDAEYLRIAEIVLQANQAGREAVRPGIAAGMVDRAARAVIEAAGYGVYFTHRTGHGLGMEAHEDPYLFGENTLLLQPGMTFTVEPGIYLPGRGGVRIEDNIAVTAQGAETLSDLPRQLGIIAA
jgi:Xaa-Pro dipeptidase